MPQPSFDATRYRWRTVTGDPGLSYLVHHDYTLLGWDEGAQTLDMLVRWHGDGGHCPLHRHVATTTVLVLDGEQHVWDIAPDGSRGAHKMRGAGDYHLMTGDTLPHLERGGPEGGLAFFGAHCKNGLLYELVDEENEVIADVTIATLVADWEANAE